MVHSMLKIYFFRFVPRKEIMLCGRTAGIK